jgi:F-type H+-transporting ATPase subunit epsilon
MICAMKLRVWLPADLLFEEEVVRIKAQAEDGWFGLLPRHVDFVTSLTPGVLVFEPVGKKEEYLAVDHGILVKRGPEVSISTRNAVRGTDLAELKADLETQFRERAERERAARALEAKLESDLVRNLLEAQKHA